MELCLVRHAIAAPRGTRYPDDRLRPLTPEGREKMVQAAKGLRRLWTPELLYTSPLLRAVETAEILREQYGALPVIEQESVARGLPWLLEMLEECEAQRVMVVGHEPHLSELLATLLTGRDDGLQVSFKKGAAALVESPRLQPGSATLEWFLPPGALRRVRGTAG